MPDDSARRLLDYKDALMQIAWLFSSPSGVRAADAAATKLAMSIMLLEDRVAELEHRFETLGRVDPELRRKLWG